MTQDEPIEAVVARVLHYPTSHSEPREAAVRLAREVERLNGLLDFQFGEIVEFIALDKARAEVERLQRRDEAQSDRIRELEIELDNLREIAGQNLGEVQR